MNRITFSLQLTGLLILLLVVPRVRAQGPVWQSVAVVPQATAAVSTSKTMAVTADAAGNVLMVGYFYGSVMFGNTVLTSAGGEDVFIAKWSPATSSFVWAQRAGGSQNDQAQAVAVQGNNIYVAGHFSSSVAAFGNITLAATLNSSSGQTSMDGFLVKLTDTGGNRSFAWGWQMGGDDLDLISSVTAVGANVYVAGMFNNTATLGTAQLTSEGGRDGFVAKLRDTGSSATLAWAHRLGGTAADEAWDVEVSGTSVYVAGYFRFGVNFGTIALSGVGNFDGYVAKLVDAGSTASFVWAQRVGGSGDDVVADIAVVGNNVYLTGSFAQYYSSTTASFGPFTLTSAGNGDAYVAKLTDAATTASFGWARRAGGPGIDYGTAVDARGTEVFVTGILESATADFGALRLARTGSQRDLYVARLSDAGTAGDFVWARQASGDSPYDVATSVLVNGTGLYVAGAIQPPAMFGPLAVPASAGVHVAYLAALADPVLAATPTPLPAAAIQLFPNPAGQAVQLRLPVLNAATAYVTLLDALGRSVREQSVVLGTSGAQVELHLSGLAPGLYHVAIRLADGRYWNYPLVLK